MAKRQRIRPRRPRSSWDRRVRPVPLATLGHTRVIGRGFGIVIRYGPAPRVPPGTADPDLALDLAALVAEVQRRQQAILDDLLAGLSEGRQL